MPGCISVSASGGMRMSMPLSPPLRKEDGGLTTALIALATALTVKGLDLIGGWFGDRRRRKLEQAVETERAEILARAEDRKDVREIDREMRGRLERIEAKYEGLYEKYLQERELRLKAEAKETTLLARVEAAESRLSLVMNELHVAQDTIKDLKHEVEELRSRTELGGG